MNDEYPFRLPLVLTEKQASLEDDCACPDSSFLFAEQQEAFENDCACSTAEASSAQPRGARLYRQVEYALTSPLPAGFWLAFSPYAPQGPSALNPPAWERWRSFATPQPLTQPVDDALAQQNLIVPLEASLRLAPSRPKILTVWLHVTNACNLACPYCYVPKSPASMSETTGLKALQKIFDTAQRHHFTGVKIKYAGGEPTLHFGLIKTLAAHAQRLADEKALSLRQVILSNGTHLHPEDVSWMAQHDIRLMISLDGLGEVHDRLRSYLDAKGSFQDVRGAVEQLLLPKGIRPWVTVTVTRRNASAIAPVVRWALERDLPVSLNFYRQAYRQGSASPPDLAAEQDALIAGMLAAYKVYEELLPLRPFLNGLLDRAQASAHLHTCGMGLSYLVVTHEGALAQCQMLLDHPLPAGSDDDWMTQAQQGPARNLSVEQKEACRACPYRYRCTGGCPLEVYRDQGRWDAPSPNCHIYQALFPHALRLEGLRLLKKHNYL